MRSLVHDRDVVRRTAEEIVTRPPYRDGEPGVLRRTLQRVLDVIGGFLADVLGTVGAVPAVAWGIVLVGLVLLGLVVWRATRGATLGQGGPAAVPASATTRSAASWLAEADEHLAAGRHEEALRARYVATVVTLIERGVLTEVPGRTIRELDAELGEVAPSLVEPVSRAGASVERVVFGDEEARAADLRAVDRAYAAVARVRASVQVRGRT
ncbi:MAG: DUF4129 domain-containing protein [Nitriliruptoraceae bacterium]